MYVIIVGAGKVGYHLGGLLRAEGHEVMLIEKDRSKVDTLSLEFHEAMMKTILSSAKLQNLCSSDPGRLRE